MAAEKQHRIVAVVDDDPRLRESLEQLFHSAGFGYRSFASAEDILQYRELGSIECLITDVRMPGMDGWELLRRIAHSFPTLPVILVTAHHDAQVCRRAIACGACAFLYKPFDGEELLNIVNNALTQSRNSEVPDVDC